MVVVMAVGGYGWVGLVVVMWGLWVCGLVLAESSNLWGLWVAMVVIGLGQWLVVAIDLLGLWVCSWLFFLQRKREMEEKRK